MCIKIKYQNLNDSSMNIITKYFNELTTLELYKILELRARVFVVEQNCAYQDLDGKDLNAHHVMGFIGEDLVASTRLLAKNISYDDYPSIGRVVNSPDYRNLGFGKKIMRYSIEQMQILYPNQSIKIGAQQYLHAFYSSLGFVQLGDEYLEDNIPHIPMILK